jgi:hypothetical protein
VRQALIRDEFLDLRGLSKDSPDLKNWFEIESHRTEWTLFHHSRSQLEPLCVLCHRKAHHE